MVTGSVLCPRHGCVNPIFGDQIVCGADFVALASMCRGKSPLGRPMADKIASDRGQTAYECPLHRGQWHTGSPIAERTLHATNARATVEALRADRRVGPRGLLQLADAWARVNRSRWSDGIDQRDAFLAP